MWSLRVLVTNLDRGDSKYDNMLPPSGHFAKFLDILFPDAVNCVPGIRKCRPWEDVRQHLSIQLISSIQLSCSTQSA